jgi:hypothetical protein
MSEESDAGTAYSPGTASPWSSTRFSSPSGTWNPPVTASDIARWAHQVNTISMIADRMVKAGLRMLVMRILRKYRYPPNKQEQATQTVPEQAKLLSADGLASPQDVGPLTYRGGHHSNREMRGPSEVLHPVGD